MSAGRELDSQVMHLLNLAYWDASQQQIDAAVAAMESYDARWFHGRLRVHLDAALRRSEAEFAAGIQELRSARCPEG